jgi:hypothetical protein
VTPPLNLHSPRSLRSTDPAPGYEAPGSLGSERRPVHFLSENIDEGGPYGSRVSSVKGHARDNIEWKVEISSQSRIQRASA